MTPLKAQQTLSSVCLFCRSRSSAMLSRHRFSTSPQGRKQDDHAGTEAFANVLRSVKRDRQSAQQSTAQPQRLQTSRPSNLFSTPAPARTTSPSDRSVPLSQNLEGIAQVARQEAAAKSTSASTVSDCHHLHVYSTRHNCHITLTRPNREPLLSVSSGKIGFRKSQRGSFDAAYQLATYSMNKMHEKGMLVGMEKLEVLLRGFGSGREAFQKALLGPEGKGVRGLVTRVVDSTRHKFGGTRSRNVRRL